MLLKLIEKNVVIVIALLIAVLLLAACGQDPVPTVDTSAIDAANAKVATAEAIAAEAQAKASAAENASAEELEAAKAEAEAARGEAEAAKAEAEVAKAAAGEQAAEIPVLEEKEYDLEADAQQQLDEAKEAGAKGVIALSYDTTEIPVVVAQQKANMETAEKYGYKAVLFDAHFDAAEQLNSFRTMIQQGVKGIVVSAIDDKAIIPALEMAKEAGIPVVMEDGGVANIPEAEGLTVSYVGADNYRAGELAGEYIAWRLKGEGKVAVMGYRTITAAYDRENGLINVLKHYPGIEMVAYGEAVGVPAGLENMQDFIQRVPDLSAVYCVNDPGCEGAYQAILAAGKEGQIFLAANDGDPLALEYMRESEGETYAYSSAQWPQVMGKIAMENLIAAIEGRDDDILNNVEIIGIPQYVPSFYVAPFPITIDTIDDYPDWTVAMDHRDIDSSPPWWSEPE
jgi:ribose transport system substrate-binding protein